MRNSPVPDGVPSNGRATHGRAHDSNQSRTIWATSSGLRFESRAVPGLVKALRESDNRDHDHERIRAECAAGSRLPTTSENRRISALFQLRTSGKAPGTVPKNSVAVALSLTSESLTAGPSQCPALSDPIRRRAPAAFSFRRWFLTPSGATLTRSASLRRVN